MILSKSFVVSASNVGTINGKKTTSIAADVDAKINELGLDVKGISFCPITSVPDGVLVTVLHEGEKPKSADSGKPTHAAKAKK